MKLIALLVLVFPIITFSQSISFRKYKLGETYRYKLTSETYRNNQFDSKSISISKHKVVKNADHLAEEISWLSKLTITPKDTSVLDSIARKVKPYTISLSPKGQVLLPKLTIPEMVGEITDLNTFFVAISPALKAHQLSTKNPILKDTTLRQGHFADSIEILYGTDCLEVTQKLISQNKKFTIIETKFTPPPRVCIEPLLDTIAKKTFNHYNNFQMIRKGNGNNVNLFWGIEEFTITAKIDNRTGKIINATMENILNLRMRYNSSQDLKQYAVEMPITIKRNLYLELLQ